MCGIFGVIKTETSSVTAAEVKTLFDRLMILSESRGKEASGLAFNDGQTVHIFKAPFRSQVLLNHPVYHQLVNDQTLGVSAPISLIGHSRLETHGSHLTNRNNQPVITPHMVGIHNGICVNYQDLWKKVKKLTAHSHLDTEAVLSFVDEKSSQGQTVEQSFYQLFHFLEGSASIVAYHTHLPQLLLATNTGSLFFVHKPGDFLVFCSELYILKKLCQEFPTLLSDLEPQQLAARSAAHLSLTTLKLTQFRLDRPSKGSTRLQNRAVYTFKDYSAPDPLSFDETASRSPLRQLKTHKPDLKAINALRRCIKCILPETMPMIEFDDQGVCNFCRQYQAPSNSGRKSLEELVAPYRSQNGEPDCIVAFSGGRDSAYGLHYLKKVLKLNPIAYTYDWGMITDLGRRNQARMVGRLGIEHILVSADIKKKRQNIRANILAWLKKPDLGMVPLFMAGDKQAEYYAEELKRKTGIKLMFYCRGNEFENEEFKWGHCGIKDGSPQGVLHNLSWWGKAQLAAYYGKQFLTNLSYINPSLIDTAFAYFVAYLMPLDFTYLWHYIPWDEKTIVSTLRKEYDWEVENDITWRIDDGSVAFYNYIFYQLQGFTENDTFRSNQIRAGIMTRAQALKLVAVENAPRYESLKWYFDQLDLDGEQVLRTIDAARRLY